MPADPRAPISRILATIRAFRDHSLVALTHPRLAREAIHVILNRKSRTLAGELRALKTAERKELKSPPVDPRALLDLLAGEMGVLLLDGNGQRFRIGVSDTDFLTALVRLQLSVPSGRLSVGGNPLNLSGWSSRNEAVAGKEVDFSFPGPELAETVLTLESYIRRIDGVWVSNNDANRSARGLYSDILRQPGLHHLSDILPAPTLDARAAEQPVDVVYTWVNHLDPQWQRLYQQYRQVVDTRHESEAGHASDDAKAISRFHSIDELQYSLRSVAKNLPWVRKIHIFTNCAVPDWMKDSHPGISWVDHSDVIPQEYLPTFSSHVIESFLHRIPDLAQQFIYLNDDVFIARPLDKSFFFHENGLSKSFLEGYGMVSGAVRKGDPDYLNAARNSAELIRDAFGVSPTRLHHHTAFALRRDVLAEIEERWPERFDTFRQHHFRSADDLNMTSFLYHHYAINTGRAVDASLEMALVKQLDVRWKNRLANAANSEVDTICVNEGGSGTPSWDWHATVLAFLKSSFPMRGPWEK